MVLTEASPFLSRFTSSSTCQPISLSICPLSSSITPSLFYSRLKTYFSTNPSHLRLFYLPDSAVIPPCRFSRLGGVKKNLGHKVKRRRREYRGAEGTEGVRCGERVSPFPTGEGSRDGAVPPPPKKTDFGAPNGKFWPILGVIFTVHENYFNCINLYSKSSHCKYSSTLLLKLQPAV